eukprot:CAMPEP_0113947118 /NCGR_PEP_ID=MMETSP1339-20121228/62368_1 /TAXON_ID=94617 /ORGANISM="Fibrocapsa japonica" /LENGTH=101 /DNA_ID=CAMNT_0000953533 /DNA_START=32 /DNA_END=333 /DNA_ORIENTATION=+ /assembly_acc=CAM_ASM_000762
MPTEFPAPPEDRSDPQRWRPPLGSLRKGPPLKLQQLNEIFRNRVAMRVVTKAQDGLDFSSYRDGERLFQAGHLSLVQERQRRGCLWGVGFKALGAAVESGR